jgi:hypothetical protein
VRVECPGDLGWSRIARIVCGGESESFCATSRGGVLACGGRKTSLFPVAWFSRLCFDRLGGLAHHLVFQCRRGRSVGLVSCDCGSGMLRSVS